MKKFNSYTVLVGVVFVWLMSSCNRDLDANLPKVTTNSVLSLTESSFECGGMVVSDGGFSVLKRGICWSSIGEPTAASENKTEDGVGLGLFLSRITGLTPETKYYYRAYATNSEGTSYGEESFIITKKSLLVPSVSTNQVSAIELTTAEAGGNITSNGGESIVRCGVCWDVNPNPTTSLATKIVLNYTTPSFTCDLSGLNYSTVYHIRAFAVNSKGVAYGEDRTFNTKTMPEMAMTSIVGGTFQMGSSNGFSNEMPVHTVTLSNFKMGTKEVTVELWNAVMPSSENRNELNNLPISGISLNDAMEFLNRLALATNKNYRLPTESEWEYVAGEGSGVRTLYATGTNDSASFVERAWYAVNSDNMIHPVATLAPNKLGIYDMGGNVLEWCSDWYGDYSSATTVNPKGATSGTKKVLRGGSFADPAANCRTSIRQYLAPNQLNSQTGFRIALTE